MRRQFIYTFAAWVVASVGVFAAPVLEMDLDGEVGNGPDVLEASVSEYVCVDLWLTGPYPLFLFAFEICNLDGSLEFQGADFLLPPTWEADPPEPVGACVHLLAVDGSFENPIPLPWMVTVATYHAAVNESWDDLTLGSSNFLDITLDDGPFDGCIGASVRIGLTRTTPANWGSVKGLFR